MTGFLIVIHTIVSLLLIAVVLMQASQGGGLSGTFGGGGDSAIVGGEPSIRDEMYVCTAESGADSCSSSSENFYSITWSRFGNIDMQKLN